MRLRRGKGRVIEAGDVTLIAPGEAPWRPRWWRKIVDRRTRRNLRNYETLGYITDDDWFGPQGVRLDSDPDGSIERFGPEPDADIRRIIGEAIARASEEDA